MTMEGVCHAPDVGLEEEVSLILFILQKRPSETPESEAPALLLTHYLM